MNKILLAFLALMLGLKLFSQTSPCWQLSKEKKQIFSKYISEKADDFEVYLKAASSNCDDSDIFFIRKDVYKQHLLRYKVATNLSMIDTLKAQIERGIVLTSNEAIDFSEFKVNRALYDSLRTKPIHELVSFFFSKEDGGIWPKYYYIYSHALALILYDYFIVFNYSLNSGIAPRFYIELVRSGCFENQ